MDGKVMTSSTVKFLLFSLYLYSSDESIIFVVYMIYFNLASVPLMKHFWQCLDNQKSCAMNSVRFLFGAGMLIDFLSILERDSLNVASYCLYTTEKIWNVIYSLCTTVPPVTSYTALFINLCFYSLAFLACSLSMS